MCHFNLNMILTYFYCDIKLADLKSVKKSDLQNQNLKVQWLISLHKMGDGLQEVG